MSRSAAAQLQRRSPSPTPTPRSSKGNKPGVAAKPHARSRTMPRRTTKVVQVTPSAAASISRRVVHEGLLRRRAAVPESSHHPPPIIVHVEEALGRGHGAIRIRIVPPHDPLTKLVVAVFRDRCFRFHEVGVDTSQASERVVAEEAGTQAQHRASTRDALGAQLLANLLTVVVDDIKECEFWFRHSCQRLYKVRPDTYRENPLE